MKKRYRISILSVCSVFAKIKEVYINYDNEEKSFGKCFG